MKKTGSQPQLSAASLAPTMSANAVMRPLSLSADDIDTSTATHVRQSHAGGYSRQSRHDMTPVSSSVTRPSIAASTAGTPHASPMTQSTTAPQIVAVVMSSLRDIGPILASRSRAWPGASGVSLICRVFGFRGAFRRW